MNVCFAAAWLIAHRNQNRLPVYASVHNFGTGTANIGNKTPPERNGERRHFCFI